MEKNINAVFNGLCNGYKNNDIVSISDFHHPENLIFNASKEHLQTILLTYKLDTHYTNIQILQEQEEIIIVRLLQITKKVDGPDFKDNTMDMVLILKKDIQEFKILSSAPISTEFI